MIFWANWSKMSGAKLYKSFKNVGHSELRCYSSLEVFWCYWKSWNFVHISLTLKWETFCVHFYIFSNGETLLRSRLLARSVGSLHSDTFGDKPLTQFEPKGVRSLARTIENLKKARYCDYLYKNLTRFHFSMEYFYQFLCSPYSNKLFIQ